MGRGHPIFLGLTCKANRPDQSTFGFPTLAGPFLAKVPKRSFVILVSFGQLRGVTLGLSMPILSSPTKVYVGAPL